MAAYSRVLLKVSGEQLAGSGEHGIDFAYVERLAEEVAAVVATGTQVAIVPGAGNWIRGASFAGAGVERATADYLGMLTSVINGQTMMDIFQSKGLQTRVMSAIHMEQISESFIRRKAIRHMEKGRVVILTCGIGKPYFTHDTAAVTYGLELDCDVVLKGTDVDGVFDKDPNKHDDAEILHHVGFQRAIEDSSIKVMDKAALGLAMEQNQKVIVFNINEPGNISRVASGESIGSVISAE